MSCYYETRRDMLVLKCDSCGEKVDLYKHQTDKTLKHDYMREHGWGTFERREKWYDLCNICNESLKVKRREEFVNSFDT